MLITMVTVILSVAVAVVVVALVVGLVLTTRALPRAIAPLSPIEHTTDTNARLTALEADRDTHSIRFDSLTLAISEGIARSDRAEKRVRKTVTSARRLLRDSGLEHAGLDAEAEEIHDGDEPASEPELVLPVPEVVGDSRPSGIPGISRSTLEDMRRGA